MEVRGNLSTVAWMPSTLFGAGALHGPECTMESNWLASELQKPSSSILPALGLQAHSVLGIRTQVLTLTQAFYPRSTSPTQKCYCSKHGKEDLPTQVKPRCPLCDCCEPGVAQPRLDLALQSLLSEWRLWRMSTPQFNPLSPLLVFVAAHPC